MILSPHVLDGALRLLDSNATKLQSQVFSDLTLGALIELSCNRWQWENEGNAHGLQFFQHLELQFPILSCGWQTLQDGTSRFCYDNAPLSVVPSLELRSVRSRADLLAWSLFEDRFARALKNNGFGNLSLGLVGAFKEMADNIIQHSGPDSQTPSSGIVAYLVVPGAMAYAVGDVGRGVLASLRENPAHQGIQDSMGALSAAIEKQASRRQRASGDLPYGFPSVLESLGTLNADLRFRSGDGLLVHQGQALVSRRRSERLVPHRGGLQLCVSCSLNSSQSPLTLAKIS